jgi:hypothetical protein
VLAIAAFVYFHVRRGRHRGVGQPLEEPDPEPEQLRTEN